MRNTKKLYNIWLISSLIITCILFFIDEGYYNFNWVLQWGNWLAFGIYATLLFASQWCIHFILSKLTPIKNTVPLSIVFGAVLALFLAFKVVFAHV